MQLSVLCATAALVHVQQLKQEQDKMATVHFLGTIKVGREDEGKLKMHPRFVMPQGE
jgi:hypothetical protein